jgi:Uncharacterized conserved protein, contains double-stranded beta-helix domain
MTTTVAEATIPTASLPAEAAAAALAFASAEPQQSLNVFGVQVDILLTAEQTGGAYSVYRVGAEPGAGSPPHVHLRDDEAFYVLEGTFDFMVGGETRRLTAGQFVFLPRNIPHAFTGAGETKGWLLGIGSPAGHEQFFVDASRLSFPPDPAEAAEVVRRHGMELLV